MPDDNGISMPRHLEPRITVAKQAWVSRPRGVNSRLAVKFRDSAQVRNDGGMPVANDAHARTEASDLHDVMNAFALRLRPMFEQSEDDLERIRIRAAIASGREQPDLPGMMFVEGDEIDLEDAANALNALGIVEYVEFIPDIVLHGGSANITVNPKAIATAPALSAAGMVGNGTPNFVPIETFIRFFDDTNNDGEWDPDGRDDLIDTEDDEPFVGGLDVDEAWDVGRFVIDRDLAVPGWRGRDNGGRGATINVGVVELAAFLKHEELNKRVRLEPGQKLLPVRIAGRGQYDHGTATLGQLVARDQGLPGGDRRRDGDGRERGIVGIVPDAQGWFFPTATRQNPGGRLMSAIAAALLLFERGDVLSFSIGLGDQGPLITSSTLAVLMRQASDLGIVTVMSAGNDCRNLDDVNWPTFDTGSIVVGAGMPTGSPNGLDPYSRLGFSNHFSEPDTSYDSLDRRVHVQAWGDEVVTLGFGDLHDPGSRRREYTAQFGGTSACAPMIAGVCAAVQGIAKSFFGTPLTPEQVRGLVAGNNFCQEGVCIGDEDQISGTEDPPGGNPCDPAQFDPEEDPDIIGGFPNVEEVLTQLFTSGFFDDSLLTESKVLRGDLEFGSVNNLKAADRNPMIVSSQQTSAGRHSGRAPFPDMVYLLTGHTTDVGAVAEVPNQHEVIRMQVTAVIATSHTDGRTIGIDVFNYVSDRWESLSQTGTTANPALLQFDIAAPQHYMENGRMLIRAWVTAFGATEPFTAFYDLIEVEVTQGGVGGGG